MAIRGQEIVSLIKRQIEEFAGDLSLVDVGTVVQVGDGIASIQGLQGVRSNELLDFGNDVVGLALNLESDLVGAAILGDPNAVKEGDRVRSTSRIIEVPVGDAPDRTGGGPGRPPPGRQRPRQLYRHSSHGAYSSQRGSTPVSGYPGPDGH